MKKFLSFLTAAAVITGMCVTPAFAGTFDSTTDQTDYTIPNPDNDDPLSHEIPVYGYIGPDTTITDSDPDNKDNWPDSTLHDINVAVPVKILWAAFASTDNNAITSPHYSIKNWSTSNGLKINITSFSPTSDTDPDVVFADDKVTLGIYDSSGVNELVPLMTRAAVPATPGTLGADYLNSDTAFIDKLDAATLGSSNDFNFTIGGTYSGSYAAQKSPAYTITFMFAVNNA